MRRLALPGTSRDQVWIWYLAGACVLTCLYLFAPPLAGNGPLINALGLSGVVAIVVGIRMHKPRARAAWWLFAAGQFLFFSGDLYTYSYPKLLGADVGFPSIGDALYLLVYPVLMAGLFILIKRRNPRPDRTALIDALILTIGIGLLSWVFLIAPNIHLTGLTLLANAVSVAYPLGDVLLLAAAIRLAVDAGKRTPAFWFLVSSIVCLMATDSAYNYALLKDTYNHQLIYDAGWILYYLLWGAGALHPSMRSLEEGPRSFRTRLTPLRLTLLGSACLIAPGIRFVQSLGNPDVLVLIVASAVLFLLVVARMAGLVRQEARVVSRERACAGRASSSSRQPVMSRWQRPPSPRSIACSAPSRPCGSSSSRKAWRSSRPRPTAPRAVASARERVTGSCRSARAHFASCTLTHLLTCEATSGSPKGRRRSSPRSPFAAKFAAPSSSRRR